MVSHTSGARKDGWCRELPRLLGRAGMPPAFSERKKEVNPMYSILYIIGAIVVIIVVLKLLGLY